MGSGHGVQSGHGVEAVVVSGLHSSPNPSPGLGVLRSLRAYRPDLRLVGLDYSVASSGLHHSLLDEAVLMPGWEQITPPVWADQIRQLLADDATLLIPTLDLEARLLAEQLVGDTRLASPPKAAYDLLGKPPVAAGELLGLATVRHTFDTDPASIEAFLRSCPHGAWVKGQHYEAFPAGTTGQARAAGAFIEQAWGGTWHLEEHLHGQEGGIAFSAVRGRLVDAVLMKKVVTTADGKTWSGSIAPLSGARRSGLAQFVEHTGWHGGGEIETITTWDGDSVVMEINPRFPAWIHGATLAGANLPASLLAEQPVRSAARPDQGPTDPASAPAVGFTRVVEEIPIHPRIGLAPYRWGPAGTVGPAAKHPSGMRALGRRTGEAAPSRAAVQVPHRPPFEPLPPDPTAATPYAERRPDLFDERVATVRRSFADRPDTVIAYSVKTSPAPLLLEHAARSGLAAEVISTDEYRVAVAAGFDPARIVLNGPAKLWPAQPVVECDALFADSLAELEQLSRRLDTDLTLTAAVIGLRLARVDGTSRFGVRWRTREDLARAARALREVRRRVPGSGWGVHFHLAQSAVGAPAWEAAATAALLGADPLTELLGERPAVVDLGGGWHPDDVGRIRESVDRVLAQGPLCLRENPIRLIIEPGKVLTQPTRAIVSRVLVVRDDDGAIVVDACLGELPDARYRSRQLLHWDAAEQRWRSIGGGDDAVFGRSCMEEDVLATGVRLDGVREGDHLAFLDAGAYDTAMAYPFGRGAAWEGRDGL